MFTPWVGGSYPVRCVPGHWECDSVACEDRYPTCGPSRSGFQDPQVGGRGALQGLPIQCAWPWHFGPCGGADESDQGLGFSQWNIFPMEYFPSGSFSQWNIFPVEFNRTFPQWNIFPVDHFPNWTVSQWLEYFPNGQFPQWIIFPLKHFPNRTVSQWNIFPMEHYQFVFPMIQITFSLSGCTGSGSFHAVHCSSEHGWCNVLCPIYALGCYDGIGCSETGCCRSSIFG